MLDFLLACLVVVAVCYIAPQIYEKLHPEEDFFSDEAIKLAKEKTYPANLSYEEIMQYVTREEFESLLKQGLINSVDDHIVFKGKYYENEFSEEWEEFEYEWDKEHSRK